MSPDTPAGSTGPAGLPESPGIDERALIQRCLAGDTAAFEPLTTETVEATRAALARERAGER